MTTTMPRIAGRPNANEYAPYYERYVSLVGGDDIEQILAAQGPDSINLLSASAKKKPTSAMRRANGALRK